MSCGAWIDPDWSSVRLICAMKESISPGENQGLSATDREQPVLTVRSVRRGDRSCNAATAPSPPWEMSSHSEGMGRFHAHQCDWGGVSIPRVGRRRPDGAQGDTAECADRERDGLPLGWQQAAAACCKAAPVSTGDGWLPRSAFRCAASAAGNDLKGHLRPASASPARAQPWSLPVSSCS